MTTLDECALGWIVGEDTGISSETIWAVMMGVPEARNMWRTTPPVDPSDFGRCYRLLSAIPEWRMRIHEIAAFFDEWDPYIERWDELERLWVEESPSGQCPKLYSMLQSIWNINHGH